MSSEIVTSNDEQTARAMLRETFLKKLISLQGKTCNLRMHENTNVRGVFIGTDVDIGEILIDDLETPTCVIPHTVVRATDTIAIEFIESHSS